MEVKIKKLHPDAVIPSYSKEGDAGLDLVAVSKATNGEILDCDFRYVSYKTGLSIEIPEGYVGLIFPRSSISKKDLVLANSVGVIDSGFRGEIEVRFKLNFTLAERAQVKNDLLQHYEEGDKIAQLVIIPYPKIEFKEVEELSDSDRGDGGFGSTGK